MSIPRIRRRQLDRRRFLKGALGGAAVSIALPRLDAMLNDHGTALAQGTPLPRRFGIWAWGNGVHVPRWVPPTVGANYTLSEQLTPLAPVKDYMSIVSGTRLFTQFPHGGHTQHGQLLTGAQPVGKLDSDVTVGRPTIDQVIAAQIGKDTALRSLEVGVSASQQGGGTVFNHWSHSGPNSPNPTTYSARDVFNRLFGGAGNAAALQLRKSILDSVLDDARELHGLVGARDRVRLDQHMDGIRTIEGRIAAIASAAPPSASCRKPAAPDLTSMGREDYDIRGKLVNRTMSELVAMALACDLTRVFTLLHTPPGSRLRVGSLGIDEWHGVTHNDWESTRAVETVKLFMSELNVFIATLKAVPEGAGSLLDNCAILGSSDVSQGSDHGELNYPLMVFGRAGGLKAGIHWKGTATDNALIVPYTLSVAVGATLGSFGVGRSEVSKTLPAIFG